MLFRYPFVAMGSGCELLLDGERPEPIQGIVRSVLTELGRLEAKYSYFRPDSWVGQVNARAACQPVPLDGETAFLLEAATRLHADTGGRFDPTVGTLRDCWDFAAMEPAQPARLAALLPAVGWGAVDWRGGALRLPHPATRLDLGGLVKEYAVDRAVAVLRGLGIDRGLVNLGGDLRVVRPVPLDARPFRVGVAHPRRPHETVGTLLLRDGAVVSSGDYQRYFLRDGRRYHHVLDPRTGEPLALDFPGVTCHGVTALAAMHRTRRLFLGGAAALPAVQSGGAFAATDADGRVPHFAEHADCRVLLHPAHRTPAPARAQAG